MPESCLELVDPRVRRTRQLLQQALASLLESRDLEKISVQDIAETATVNRATFYDHYADKFVLLESMVAARFHELLDRRGVRFDAGCESAVAAIVLGVCDYLAEWSKCRAEPHMERAIIGVVRWMLLEGFRKHGSNARVALEMVATTASWAIFGAAKEWVDTPSHCASEEIVPVIVGLVHPLFNVLAERPMHA